MTLDDKLRYSLQSSYCAWEPEAPHELPPARRSHTPLIAGVTISAIGAVGLAVAVTFTNGTPSPGTPSATGPQTADKSIPACGVEDAHLVVTSDKTSYLQQPVSSSSQPTEERSIKVKAELVANSTTPCRLFYESGQLKYIGPSGQVREGIASCLDSKRRYNRTGPTPAPATDRPWCKPTNGGQSARPTPTENPTNPGENDDYGVLFAKDAPTAGGSQASTAAEARKGKLTSEPTYGSVPVEDSGNSGRFDVGQWSATYTYGPWSAHANFQVMPSN